MKELLEGYTTIYGETYADEIILQCKTTNYQQSAFRTRTETPSKGTPINTNKCEMISDNPNDLVMDCGVKVINGKNTSKYLGRRSTKKAGTSEHYKKAHSEN